jgi:hypothetical protein
MNYTNTSNTFTHLLILISKLSREFLKRTKILLINKKLFGMKSREEDKKKLMMQIGKKNLWS